MKYDTLKALVNAKVYENTEQRITGGDMNAVLQSAIASLGAHYQMGGLVSPTDHITVGDEPVVFIATTPGTYTYFGSQVVADGEVSLLVWSGTAWSKQTPDIATRTEVGQLGQEVDELSQSEPISLFKGHPARFGILFTADDIYNAKRVYYNFDTTTGILGYIEFMDANGIRLSYVGKGSSGSGATHYEGYEEVPEGFAYARYYTSSGTPLANNTINRLVVYPTSEYYEHIKEYEADTDAQLIGKDVGLIREYLATDVTSKTVSASNFNVIEIEVAKDETFEFRVNAVGAWTRIMVVYNEKSSKRAFDSEDGTTFIGNYVKFTAPENITSFGLYYTGSGTASLSIRRIIGISKVGQEVLADSLSMKKNILFNRDSFLHKNTYYNGSFNTDANYSSFLLNVVSGTTYYFNHIRFIYDTEGNKLIDETQNGFWVATLTGTVGVSFFNTETDWVFTTESNTDSVPPFNWVYFTKEGFYNATKWALFDSNNLLTDAEKKVGYYYNGYEQASSAYTYYRFTVKPGHTYKISPGIRFLSKDNASIASFSNYTQSEYTYVADYNGQLFVTFVNDAVGRYAYDSATPAYSLISPEFLPTYNKNDVLFAKKWVSCGDSFTQGDFTGASNFKFTDMPYMGYNKVYPYYIGRRCGMDVVNEAISGSTMAYVDGNRNEFSTPGGRYTQIPADADYITLWFGINDSHQNVPIGTIDDNVNTTFYGAWNIVMAYLLEHHPNAKIGIVISNGCDTTAYPIATRAIARKWGVSYLDLNGDYKVPLMLRTNEKTEVAASVLQAILEKQAVNYPSNQHPNVAAHEYQSTFIEEWLRSL